MLPIPWKQLIVFTPQIIELSRELVKRVRGKQAVDPAAPASGEDDIAQRVALLEENERRQAELVERMATQQAQLSRAVLVLHRRQRWLIVAVVVLALTLAWRIASS